MKTIEISANSWHAKLFKHIIGRHPESESNICIYFWKCMIAILVLVVYSVAILLAFILIINFLIKEPIMFLQVFIVSFAISCIAYFSVSYFTSGRHKGLKLTNKICPSIKWTKNK